MCLVNCEGIEEIVIGCGCGCGVCDCEIALDFQVEKEN